MARLIVKAPEIDAPEYIDLGPGVNRLGRDAGNEHQIADPSVSVWHCEVRVDKEFIMVRDLRSTNGTYIDRQRITEAALYPGQTLRLGEVEMTLDAADVRVAIPQLPVPENPYAVQAEELEDGFVACLNHAGRHAVWECTHCARVYCDECVRKMSRVGGVPVRLCPACSNRCVLSAWSESVKRRKRSIFTTIADTVKAGFKRTTRLLSRPPAAATPKKRRNRRG